MLTINYGALVFFLLSMGCSGLSGNDKICYQHREHGSETVLTLSIKPPLKDEIYSSTLTVSETKNGKKVADNFEMKGRVENQFFILADGSTFEFGDQFKLADSSESRRFPENKNSLIKSPMDGLIFDKVECF